MPFCYCWTLRSWNWLSGAERIKEQEFTKEHVFLFETDFLNNEPIKYAQTLYKGQLFQETAFVKDNVALGFIRWNVAN